MAVQIIKRIAIGVGLATLLVIAVSFMLPSTYTVTRSVTVNASPAVIHSLVADLERWPEWTPFLEADPTTVVTFGDKTTGVGASQSWKDKSGSGELVFTRSDPDWGIAYDMVFDQGDFSSECDMTYRVEGDRTEVTWRLTGENGMNVLKRYMGLVMDKWVGPMFEDGLNKLRLVAETNTAEGA